MLATVELRSNDLNTVVQTLVGLERLIRCPRLLPPLIVSITEYL